MQVELKRIQREVGITFVYVTHDQGEALTMSDRIAVMNDGPIEHLGTPREIYERPATKFVAGFIGTSNLLSGTVSRVVDERTQRRARRSSRRRARRGAGARRRGARPGDALELSVRPEKIDLQHGAAGRTATGSVLRGVVTEVVYLGTSTNYNVTTSTGAERRGVRPERLLRRRRRGPRRHRLALLGPAALVRDWSLMNEPRPPSTPPFSVA